MHRILLALVVLLCSIPAAAQESGQAGLVTGYPANVGILWHVSDTVAIRPDFTFSHSSTESENSGTEGSSTSYGFGVAALWYVAKLHDNLRGYITPRFSYQRATSDNSSGTLSSKGHGNAFLYSGAFGVQYSPSRRFSLFGEAGLAFGTSDSTTDYTGSVYISPTTKTTGSAFGTRTGVGVVVYFN